MPTTFGREILGRDVIDQAGDKLGVLTDFRIDIGSGNVTALLVNLELDLDPSMLPWPTVDGLLSVPVSEVAEVAASIQLAR
tara:strand:+ start:27440 stop:27682 length:243 start_codon:yes stop_codon:yes gene_type:complete